MSDQEKTFTSTHNTQYSAGDMRLVEGLTGAGTNPASTPLNQESRHPLIGDNVNKPYTQPTEGSDLKKHEEKTFTSTHNTQYSESDMRLAEGLTGAGTNPASTEINQESRHPLIGDNVNMPYTQPTQHRDLKSDEDKPFTSTHNTQYSASDMRLAEGLTGAGTNPASTPLNQESRFPLIGDNISKPYTQPTEHRDLKNHEEKIYTSTHNTQYSESDMRLAEGLTGTGPNPATTRANVEGGQLSGGSNLAQQTNAQVGGHSGQQLRDISGMS